MTTATDTDVDPYGLSTGLIDDFIGEVTEAYFGLSTGNYVDSDGNPVPVLTLEIATDNPDKPAITETFSVGANWSIEDGGKRLVRERGKNQYSNTSRAGELLAYALNSGAGDTMRAKGSPMEAATWQGLRFYWERVDITGKDGTVKNRLLPTRFEGAGAPAAAASSTPAADECSPALRAQLLLAAKGAADQSAFIDAAFQIPGVDSNAAAVALVTSDEFYAQAKG